MHLVRAAGCDKLVIVNTRLLPAIALLFLAGAVGCSEPAHPVDDLSVIVVTLDTTRADRIGAFGGTAVPTPHLDRIADEGVRFSRALSQVPLTLPAHSTIFTGRYPATHGVRHNGIYKLPDSETTLAERLKVVGFESAAFVGAFVLNHGYGLNQGFDHYNDIAGDRYEGGGDRLFEAHRTAQQVNARVFEWLDEPRDGRVFLWVHYYDPHDPYTPPEDSGFALSGAGYDREISYVDFCFGELIDRLERDGILDRSILVVVGDHGESLGEHQELTHGVFLYENALRVPLMIRAPGRLKAGRGVEHPVGIIDVAPTLLEMLELPPLEAAQGKSLLDAMRGKDRGQDRLVYAETLMPRLEFGWSELRMVSDERYKYIAAPRSELYDLRNDPGETQNLLSLKSELGGEMAALLDDWMAGTDDAEAGAEASRDLSADEEAKLRSLGYLGGDAFKAGDTGGLLARPDPKDMVVSARKLTTAGDLLEAGEVEESLRLTTEILAEVPGNHLARSKRIQALIRLQRLEEAVVEAEAAVVLAEQDPDASLQLLEKARRVLASVYWMIGRNDEAEEQYRMAIELNTRNSGAPVFSGILLGAAGGMEEARRLVADVLSRNPRDGAALAARFELEVAAKDDQAALKTAVLLSEVRAGDPPTLIKAGRLLRGADRPAAAVACFEAALEKMGPNADLLGYLGMARLAAGDPAGAEEALLQVRELRPDDPRAPFYLGNIALMRNDETRARTLFDQALALNPEFVPPLVNLARWLEMQGRRDEARSVLEDALRRRPGDPGATQALASLAS